MAHLAEPMDVDDVNGFDNKENTCQHSNVLSRTPCTEKGYEELDVSELNMKLRYSITPAASPMSKSMSHCLDNRQNTMTDESLNNTVINDYENNLTRSLNSTLNKTELKSSKVLPLQALPTDVDSSSSVLRPFDSVAASDITITVSNQNEIDNLSFPSSSSSSMAHTPEATTPTKEISKQDGGSPIMRGLKSVLSMFRSSQSPILPGEEEPHTENPVVSPSDVPLLESKPRAIASTPKSERIKDQSLSRKNSPHKESIVFNDDLENQLQWNDDSTIVFNTEKIPIHKLFFQEKPSKSTILAEYVREEDANSTVEYMDVSYNDLSVRERTLNGTVNKSKLNDLLESDAEFVDCETTFTQNEAESIEEKLDAANIYSQIPIAPETTVKEPFALDTTKDILNSIDDSHLAVEDLGETFDVSTTNIVNQLSDLINESETSETNVISTESKDTVILDKQEFVSLENAQTINNNKPELLDNQVISPVNTVPDSSTAVSDHVSIQNEGLVHTSGIICHTSVPHEVSVDTKISLTPVNVDAVEVTLKPASQILCEENKTEITPDATSGNASYASPVDIPLPSDDDINEINHKSLENVDSQDKNDLTMSQNALMAALDKTNIESTPDIHQTQVEPLNNVITCPSSVLPSDGPLHIIHVDNLVKTNENTHEAITVVHDPVQSQAFEKLDAPVDVSNTNIDGNDPVVKSLSDAVASTACALIGVFSVHAQGPCLPSVLPSDIRLPIKDDDNTTETHNLAKEARNESIQRTAEKLEEVLIQDKKTKVDTTMESTIIKPADVVIVVDQTTGVTIEKTISTNHIKTEEEHMEISFVESNEDKLSETMTVDVSMVDASVKVEGILNQPEVCLSDTLSNFVPSLPETVTENIETIASEIVNTGVVGKNDNNKQVLEGMESDFEKTIVENANNDTGIKPVNDMSTDEYLSVIDALKSETIASAIEINVTEEDKHDVTIITDSNINHEGIADVISDIASTTMAQVSLKEDNSAIPLLATDVMSNPTEFKDLIKNPDTTVNLDLTQKVESSPEGEVNVDEEIMLSESNSPFVSMSAEEELDSESKKENFEEVDNPVTPQTPPISSKIVSKGYNFNFDDIDSMDPFATKTKIRMSPPPGTSPNNSITSDKLNKTEIVKPSKSQKDTNRRKSMPARKKPLKAKRHLLDSTETLSPIATPSKNSDVNNVPEIESLQKQTQLSHHELNFTDKDIAAPVTDAANNDKLNITVGSEIITKEEKVYEAPESVHGTINPNDNNVRPEEEMKIKEDGETNAYEDVVMSASSKSSIKPEATSSSEQSTYFSAGVSSTELTDSKNVFNLPELDDFNPFATKSRIRQSPSGDFDVDNPFATKLCHLSKVMSSPESSLVVAQDCNSTVNIVKEDELQDANYSGSSMTSDEKDVTVQEVHTEDEDTLEGPFLEADDGNDNAKIPELPDDKVDVVDFNNLNQQDNDDAAEMFIDAEAFEFLMNQNNTDEVAYSGKESLFLKFDPLFAGRVTSEGVSAALNDINRKRNTPKKTTKQVPHKEVELSSFEKPGPSNLNDTYEAPTMVKERPDDINVTVCKPMMAVTPAVNPVVTPRKSLTPNRSNRLSMTFTSPAMAVIDRLLSLSANSSSQDLDTTVTQADRSQNEADQALTQLRELLAEKEINVYNLRCESKDLKDRLSTLETQMKALEAESAERLKKVNELSENLAEKTKMNRNMAAVVEEYERTIASLISETEQDKKRFAEERNQLIRDRDEQTAHLASMEFSFNDIHSKYEKSKQVITAYKTNEDAYKKSIQDFEENLAKMLANYELLKQHATSKLNHANQELEKINKAHEAEVLKFNAMIKRKEMHITSLEESLMQKTKANEELTAICDELINKVG